MAIYSAHRLSFLLMAFSLSGCSSMAKMETAPISTAASTATPLVVEAAPAEATVITSINVDAPTIQKMEPPVLSKKASNTKSKSTKKKKRTLTSS